MTIGGSTIGMSRAACTQLLPGNVARDSTYPEGMAIKSDNSAVTVQVHRLSQMEC